MGIDVRESVYVMRKRERSGLNSTDFVFLISLARQSSVYSFSLFTHALTSSCASDPDWPCSLSLQEIKNEEREEIYVVSGPHERRTRRSYNK